MIPLRTAARVALLICCVLSALADVFGGAGGGVPAQTPQAAGAMPVLAAASTAPRAAIAPDAGPPASTFTLVGSGFPIGVLLTIVYMDLQNRPATLGVAVAATNGSIEATNMMIPQSAAPGGIGIIAVREAKGGRALSSMPFAVTPLAANLLAAPDVTTPGGTIILNGSGLQPDSAVQLQVLTGDGPVAVLGTEPITSTGMGAIGPLAITVPITLTVAHPTWAAINVVDAVGAIAGIPLLLLPAAGPDTGLRVQPARSVLGARVRVAATGFAPGEAVSITLIGASGISAAVQAFQAADTGTASAGGSFGAVLAADGNGYADGIFVVPLSGEVVLNDAPGTATGDGGTMLMVSLHGMQSGITRTAPLVLSAPRIQPLPTITTPGHGYTILGSGFAAGEQVRVLIADSSGASALVGYFTAAKCGDPAAIPPGGAPGTDVPVGSSCVSGSFAAIATAPTPAGDSATGTQTYSVSATGAISGLAASNALMLAGAPTLTLQRYVVAPGQSIMVQGNAFAPNATATIQAAFPSRTTAGCAGGSGTTPHGTLCNVAMLAATGSDGSFKAQVTVPLAAQDGPVTIQARDSREDQASVVLTVNTQPPALHLPGLAAHTGQVVTIRGGGFSSGETVDVSLAVPSVGTSQSSAAAAACGALRPQVLPNSTLTTTADALGSFTIAYPMPDPFAQGTYYVAAIGETSRLCAFDPISIENQAPTPLPTSTPCVQRQCQPVATPTATSAPVVCDQGAGAQTEGCATDTVLYFAEGSTAQIATSVQAGTSYPGTPCTEATTAAATLSRGKTALPCVPAIISFREDLHLLNESDQPVSVDIAYFIYGVSAAQYRAAAPGTTNGQPFAGWITPSSGGNLQVARRRTIVLPPHAAIARSVNQDIGGGHLVSIIVRAAGLVIASTVSSRALLVEGCASGAARACKKPGSAARPCTYSLDAAGSAGSGPAGPQTTWLFAQGYRGGAFNEYVSLLNPQTDPAIVQLRILTPQGAFPGVFHIDIPAGGRQSIDVDSAVQTLCAPRARGQRTRKSCALHDGSIGLQLSSTEPIVAERTLLWGAGSGPARAGYDVGPGAPAIVTRNGAPVTREQYLPYASTLHGDQAYLALLDPTIHRAVVTVSAYSAAGMHLADRTIVVPAQGCATVSLAGMVFPGIYALVVRSATAVTGELAQYSGGSPQTGVHPGFVEPLSAAQPAGGSALLNATAGDVLVRVFNPANRRIVARVSVVTATGWSTLAQYQIAAHATLQSTIPVSRAGRAAATGVSVGCSGPCAGLVLIAAGGEPAGASVGGTLWSDALR